MTYKLDNDNTPNKFSALYSVSIARLIQLNPVHALALGGDPDGELVGIDKLEVGGVAILGFGKAINQELLDKYGVNTIAAFKDLNDRHADVLQRCFDAPRAMGKRAPYDVKNLIVVHDGTPPVVVPLGPVSDPNPTFEWLFYETRANATVYQKEPLVLAYGLYAAPLDHRAEVVASRELPKILADAFFPGMSVSEVQAFSDQSCRWRVLNAAAPIPLSPPNSPASQLISRTEAVIHSPQMVVFPYNYFANDTLTHSIGTTVETDIVPGPAYRLKKCWPLWETASRSSVSILEPTAIADLAPSKRLDTQWPFRSKLPVPGGAIPAKFVGEIFDFAGFKNDNCYSVKTGVRWLGNKPQGHKDSSDKDVLESNALLASMRSDWAEYVEEQIGPSPFLIVLRELLTVTYKNATPGRDYRDGFQIRDLRPLTTDKSYFPPLSIPFGGQEFFTKFQSLNPQSIHTYESFWGEHYAAALGRAKAEFLLRYGLQLTTPNAQNMLIEFDRATFIPTGRIVIRDIGDAKLHSEVIARLGTGQPVIEYELRNPARPGYLPAQTNNADRALDDKPHDRLSMYPLDTRTHWHQYSSFGEQYGRLQLPDKTMTTVRWGRAHFTAYVDHLATVLEEPDLRVPVFGQEAWDNLLAPSHPINPKVETYLLKDYRARALQLRDNAIPSYVATVAEITPAILDRMIQDKVIDDNAAGIVERTLEAFTDEILHAKLCATTVLDKIKTKWVR